MPRAPAPDRPPGVGRFTQRPTPSPSPRPDHDAHERREGQEGLELPQHDHAQQLVANRERMEAVENRLRRDARQVSATTEPDEKGVLYSVPSRAKTAWGTEMSAK